MQNTYIAILCLLITAIVSGLLLSQVGITKQERSPDTYTAKEEYITNNCLSDNNSELTETCEKWGIHIGQPYFEEQSIINNNMTDDELVIEGLRKKIEGLEEKAEKKDQEILDLSKGVADAIYYLKRVGN